MSVESLAALRRLKKTSHQLQDRALDLKLNVDSEPSSDLSGGTQSTTANHDSDHEHKHSVDENPNEVNGNISLPVISQAAKMDDHDQGHAGDDNVDDDAQPKYDPRRPDPALSTITQSFMDARASKKPFSHHQRPQFRIGIVGVKPDEGTSLEKLYPDVEFTYVNRGTQDIVSTLSKCQKVIGVDGFVNPLADGLLKQELASRYVSVSGGLPSIKRQIASWLRVDEAMTT